MAITSGQHWEAVFGRLLLDDAFRQWVWGAGATALAGYDLRPGEVDSFLALDHASVERAALGLKRKRLTRLRNALPLALRCLGAERDLVVLRFCVAYPTVPSSCAVEVQNFGALAARHAASIGADWLSSLIDYEVAGHLSCCRDAIDAEGVVLGHLVVHTPTNVDADDAPLDLDLRTVAGSIAPTAWTARYAFDVVEIARWLVTADAASSGCPTPPENLLERGDFLVARRPDPNTGSVIGVTLRQPVDQLWTALDGVTPLGTLIDRVGPSTLANDAWVGIVRRLAHRGLVVLAPVRRFWPWTPHRSPPSRVVASPKAETRGSLSSPISSGRGPGSGFGDAATPDLPRSMERRVAPWPDDGMPRFGIGLRRPYVARLLADSSERLPHLDCLEIYADDYIRTDAATRAEVANLRARYPLVPHGLELSIGSIVPPAADYVSRVAGLIGSIGAPYYTEHLAWTQAVEWRPGHLCPVVLDRDALLRITKRIEHIQDVIGVPLAVENISYDVLLPGGGLAEADFLRALCEHSNCGLLVDVTNVIVNAHNHHFDPHTYVDRLPPDRVFQLHLVGYTRDGDGTMIDAHAQTTQSDVLAVARHLLDRGARPRAVILERDQSLPSLDALLGELEEIRLALTR